MRIFLNGFMGSGKTTLSKKLSNKMNVSFFDLDKEIEQRSGMGIVQIFKERGEEVFRKMERDTLMDIIRNEKDFVMACGGGTACFYNNIKLMNENGISVFLDVEEKILLGRLRNKRSERPLLKSLNELELKEFIMDKLNKRRLYYEQCSITLCSNNPSASQILKAVVSFQKD